MLKLTKILERIISGLAGLALLTMMFLSLANALGRTWFQAPIYGANEIAANWLLPAFGAAGHPGRAGMEGTYQRSSDRREPEQPNPCLDPALRLPGRRCDVCPPGLVWL